MKLHIKKWKNKKGSYILEAAVSLPILIIAITTLLLIVNIISSCNELIYNASIDLRDISIENYYSKEVAYVKYLDTLNDISSIDNSKCEIVDTNYLYSDSGIDNLISIDIEGNYSILNSIGISGKVSFDCNVLTRAFLGKESSTSSLSIMQFTDNSSSNIVVIFPRYGIRYHKEDCKYVVNYKYDDEFMLEIESEEAIMRGYTPCLVCGGTDE